MVVFSGNVHVHEKCRMKTTKNVLTGTYISLHDIKVRIWRLYIDRLYRDVYVDMNVYVGAYVDVYACVSMYRYIGAYTYAYSDAYVDAYTDTAANRYAHAYLRACSAVLRAFHCISHYFEICNYDNDDDVMILVALLMSPRNQTDSSSSMI